MAELTVAFQCWNKTPARYAYFRASLTATRKLIAYSDPAAVDWLAVAERQGQAPGLEAQFDDYCSERGVRVLYHGGPPDLGAARNVLFAAVQTPYVLYTQDDLMPVQPLDVADGVRLLHHNVCDRVHYRWAELGPGHTKVGPVFRPQHAHAQYRRFAPDSDWMYTDWVYLARLVDMQRLGPFIHHDLCNVATDSEVDMARRVRAAGLRVFGYGDGRWAGTYVRHIGAESVQDRGQAARLRGEPSLIRPPGVDAIVTLDEP
jgi:hypothetical protein